MISENPLDQIKALVPGLFDASSQPEKKSELFREQDHFQQVKLLIPCLFKVPKKTKVSDKAKIKALLALPSTLQTQPVLSEEPLPNPSRMILKYRPNSLKQSLAEFLKS